MSEEPKTYEVKMNPDPIELLREHCELQKEAILTSSFEKRTHTAAVDVVVRFLRAQNPETARKAIEIYQNKQP